VIAGGVKDYGKRVAAWAESIVALLDAANAERHAEPERTPRCSGRWFFHALLAGVHPLGKWHAMNLDYVPDAEHSARSAFLSPELGGRHEPIGAAFQGWSLTAPGGADLVPGLSEALKKAGR
jgi:hypothetical protein